MSAPGAIYPRTDSPSQRPRPLNLIRHQLGRLEAVSGVVGWWHLPWLAPLWLLARRYRIVTWSAADGLLPGAGFPDEARRSPVSADDLGRLTEVNPLWRRRQLERRLDAGCRGSFWTHRGRIVHVRWQSAAPTWLPYLGIDFEPGPGDLLSLEAFTPSDNRRQGLYAAGLAWMLAEARRTGNARCVFLAAWWNRPILRLLESIGARTVGRVDALRLGPRLRHRVAGSARLRDRSALSIDPWAE